MNQQINLSLCWFVVIFKFNLAKQNLNLEPVLMEASRRGWKSKETHETTGIADVLGRHLATLTANEVRPG